MTQSFTITVNLPDSSLDLVGAANDIRDDLEEEGHDVVSCVPVGQTIVPPVQQQIQPMNLNPFPTEPPTL